MTANYKKVIIESIKTLHEYGFNSIPIDLNIIINALHRTISLCSHSEFSKQPGMNINEICDYFESDLGACAYNKDSE